MFLLQSELDLEKGLEMRKWVLSGILASEETYLSHLEALLLVRRVQGAEQVGVTWPRSQVSCQSLAASTLLRFIETCGRVIMSHLCRSRTCPRVSGYQCKTGASQAGFTFSFLMESVNKFP